jgi:hypothetical protein
MTAQAGDVCMSGNAYLQETSRQAMRTREGPAEIA